MMLIFMAPDLFLEVSWIGQARLVVDSDPRNVVKFFVYFVANYGSEKKFSGGADLIWDVDTAFSREGLGQVRFDVGDGLSCVLQAPASGLPVRGGSGHAIQGSNAIAAWSRQGSSVLQVAYASRHLCGHISACYGSCGNR
ncbi:hypothetical protein V6N12_027837 [Hibiscus sabdariffa]|uniref:Uncharacterized protein n=1 Tax=Hibiscus sabdariffa TaxID=183260 RepID=A0ABR2F430_9ROSI